MPACVDTLEQLITVPMEQDLVNAVAFLDEIESASLPGLSSFILTLERGTDLLDARQVVAERLTQAVGVAGLPEVANPSQMLQPLSSTSRVAMVKLPLMTCRRSRCPSCPVGSSDLGRWGWTEWPTSPSGASVNASSRCSTSGRSPARRAWPLVTRRCRLLSGGAEDRRVQRQIARPVQLKYYALDLGNIRTGWKGKDESKEELELVEIEHLTAAEMAEVRCSALALEVRAYVTSKLVYGTTPPSEVR